MAKSSVSYAMRAIMSCTNLVLIRTNVRRIQHTKIIWINSTSIVGGFWPAVVLIHFPNHDKILEDKSIMHNILVLLLRDLCCFVLSD